MLRTNHSALPVPSSPLSAAAAAACASSEQHCFICKTGCWQNYRRCSESCAAEANECTRCIDLWLQSVSAEAVQTSLWDLLPVAETARITVAYTAYLDNTQSAATEFFVNWRYNRDTTAVLHESKRSADLANHDTTNGRLSVWRTELISDLHLQCVGTSVDSRQLLFAADLQTNFSEPTTTWKMPSSQGSSSVGCSLSFVCSNDDDYLPHSYSI